jgi:hypothetical protein
MTDKATRPTDVITCDVRLAFPSLATRKPRARGSEKLTFQATLLFPPAADLNPVKEAVKAAMMRKWGKLVKLAPRNNPLKAAGDKDYAGFEPDWTYIATNSDRAPGLVNRRSQPLALDAIESTFYPGCWVRAFVNAFAWEHPTGGQGVSFGLMGLQFIRDDERFDGRRNASEVFVPLDMDDAVPGAGPPASDEFDPFA